MNSSELIDMIMSDASPTDVSDTIKQMLYTNSSKTIDEVKPYVANAMFNPESSEEA